MILSIRFTARNSHRQREHWQQIVHRQGLSISAAAIKSKITSRWKSPGTELRAPQLNKER